MFMTLAFENIEPLGIIQLRQYRKRGNNANN